MSTPTFQQYLTEAPLYAKASGGGRKWDRYRKNSNLSKIDFELEKNADNVPLLDDAGNQIGVLHGGDRLRILDNKERDFPSLAGTAPSVKIRTATGEEGWVQLSKIRNPYNKSTTAVEDLVHGTIRNKFATIVDNEGPFTLYIDGKHKMENVVDIIQPPGDPKADFVILNDKKKGVGFISHKKEGGPKAFQQYGGISPRVSGLAKYGNRRMIEEVDQFIVDVEAYLINNPEDARVSRIWREVKTPELIGFSIFGFEYGSSTFSLNNVNVIGQGDAIIEPYKDGYNLTFSDTTHHNSRNLKWAMSGAAQACLIARSSPGENRKMTGIRKKVVVEYRRGLIAPKALITGSSVRI